MSEPGVAGSLPIEGIAINLELQHAAEALATLVGSFASTGVTLGIGHDGGAVFTALGRLASGQVRVHLLTLLETPGSLPSPPPGEDMRETSLVAPANMVDAVVFDDDLVRLPHDRRQQVVEEALASSRSGGRILVVLSEAGRAGSADLPHDHDPALDPAAFFGHPELRLLRWTGRGLDRQYGFELVFEKPWPGWVESLPALLRPARRLVRWRVWFRHWRRALERALRMAGPDDSLLG